MSEPVPAPQRSRVAVRQAWVERLDRFAAAPVPVVDFCRHEGISAQAFYYWRNKLAADTASEPAAGPRLLPGCDLAFVRSLLEALGGAPC